MKHTAATKRKLSAMRMGELNPFYGRRHTPATRKKLRKVLDRARLTRTFVSRPQSILIPSEPTALGYLAGLIDGEGSFTITKGVTARVIVYNTNRAAIRWLVKVIGGAVSKPDMRGRLPCFAWSVTAHRDVLALSRAVLPLLIIKKLDAARIIAHVEAALAKQERANG